MLNRIIRYFLENKLVTILLLLACVIWGLVTAPFGWKLDFLPSDPVPVDAIPDIGENQQIVFTEWMGRSPQDIEDQITYPLTTSLLGIPGVKSIRSSSILGASSIYIIFSEEVEFYWSRSRILEKLSSLPAGLLPNGVQPTLGPDATALGQVYWYTLEGRDPEGNPTGGWDLHELRKVQDFYVKYGLNAVEGVSEVASIGGFVQEYQVDVNPEALRVYGISLQQVISAVRQSNRDVGAQTIEINQAEYLVRGLGYVRSVEDLEQAVVTVSDNVPIRIRDIGIVALGPATRRGLLDKDGAEVVGGVVVARYGSNPLAVITEVKDKIKVLSAGLPKKTLANGVESQLTLVPFYDRTQLIHETLGTLEEALSLEVLITILVVIVMVLNLRASLMIASLLPIAVLMVFVAMRYVGVDANIVALSGIAIAIGTMVDLGIVLSENIIQHIREAPASQNLKETIYKAAAEVSGALVTAVATTVVSFIPVFAMEAAEGKLFRPLAFTKTFALLAALFVSLIILPTLAQWFFGIKIHKKAVAKVLHALLVMVGFVAMFWVSLWAGLSLLAFGVAWFVRVYSGYRHWVIKHAAVLIAVASVTWLLAKYWMPLGVGESTGLNFLFVALVLVLILGGFALLEKFYGRILDWCLAHKRTFLALPTTVILFGAMIWIGFGSVFGWMAKGLDVVGVNLRAIDAWSAMTHTFPGIGKEFMPSLDEGSFLLMPSSMPHAGMSQNKRVVQQLDMLVANIPEVELSVGKMGRAETALDPAPISMYENVINYRSEYRIGADGHRQRYLVDDHDNYVLTQVMDRNKATRRWVLDRHKKWLAMDTDTVYLDDRLQPIGRVDVALGYERIVRHLVPDQEGEYFRNWREEIQSPDDIWEAIVAVTHLPGVTSAPKLQPIETRLVMLQTGMRAPMGIKVFGPDLQSIEDFGMKLEEVLKHVPSVKTEAVFADRIVGKPYIHLRIDRESIARYGLSIEAVQQAIETAVGGVKITETVEGRERFPVRVRYPRELRDDPSTLADIYIPTPVGVQVPMSELVHIEYAQGPQMIKSEDTFLLGYVLLDKRDGYAEVDVVEAAQQYIQDQIDQGVLVVPAGVSFKFSGSYENQVRAEKRLAIIVPVVLVVIFMILYFQFRSISTSLMIFAGIAMAFSGAFLMLWLYGQSWFLDFSFMGSNMRDLFQLHTVNLSVAVWVGFIALFGIATDDGVLIGTYLDYSLAKNQPKTIDAVRRSVREAGSRRIKPAIMTTATTIIALLPVLTSSGRGSDIMIPMAIPAFGGMFVAAITYFITPVLYSWREERKLNKRTNDKGYENAR
ncbi:cation transporter [Reichenbachiella sp. 5M10]|uniref:efflux RND transporter permease subunit n=1 Tax=Reichenbachiella sp. 5M10 TaxID=1889772 RepID=UPI000C15CB85|nr:efflux RND transporter permease subunit [Reichenbachiella sp. 5M10]PIB34932.1 cation transporter [Reichenbachiella sp. 5M10]